MNAFKYSTNEAAPAQEMRTPIIALVALSAEGKKDQRLMNLGNALAAHELSFADFSDITV